MMKFAMVLVAFLVLFLCSLNAQIPNSGFESWTSGNPNNWLSNNIPLTATPITRSTEAHSGSYALKGSVVTLAIVAYPPVLVSGSNGIGFAMSSRPATLNGFVKLTLVGGDTFYVAVGMKKSSSVVSAGYTSIGINQSSYEEFTVNIIYGTSDVPDTGIITMGIAKTTGVHAGSFFIVDDLSFGPATAVHEMPKWIPLTFALSQNYPNPFNPSTTIRYSLPEQSSVTLRVYNTLGQLVDLVANAIQQAGNQNVTWNSGSTPSGVYFYRLDAVSITDPMKSFTQVKKMLLVK